MSRHLETPKRNTQVRQPRGCRADQSETPPVLLMALLLTCWTWLKAMAGGVARPAAPVVDAPRAMQLVAARAHRPDLAFIHAPLLRLLT